MRKVIAALALFGLLAWLPAVASAQDGGKKKSGRKKEAILRKFDKDGDGKLSEEEKAAAREFKSKRRAEEGRDGKKGLRKDIFKRFDKDGDKKLSDEERENLRKFLDSHRKEGKKGKAERGRRSK